MQVASPELRWSHLLGEGVFDHPITLPAPAYHAYVNLAGLYVSVDAPCGCKVHFDTSWSERGLRQVCESRPCSFDWDLANAAAQELLDPRLESEPSTVEFDLGGEA